jgi:hypothetical protein
LAAALPMRDLEPGTTYCYRATDAAGNSSVGRFRTAPAACADTRVRFGVSGDSRPELTPYPAIRILPSRNLDFFIDHRDTICAENYSDPSQPTAATLPEYRAKYAESMATRLGLNTRRDLHGSTAILATIDDHEVTNDFAGGAPPATDPRFDDSGAYINETQRYRDGLQAFHTIVNNLTYQNAPFTAQIPSDTFEMVTGAVALDAPFGQTVMGLATQLGLANSGLDATLVSGDYTSAHTCGWTEFDVDPATKELRVVTYGIAPYTAADWRTTRAGLPPGSRRWCRSSG